MTHDCHACSEYNRLSRRQFLGWTGAAAAGAALAPAWLPRVSFAGQGGLNGRDVLVSIFLRGGADGLTMCVPFGDPAYYTLRSSLAIMPPDASTNPAVDLNGYFCLPGALAVLARRGANLPLSVTLPVSLQSSAGLPAGESGVGMLGLLLGTVFGATMSGRMVARVVHYKRIATFGVTFAIACLLVMAYLADSASLLVVELLTVAAGIGTGTTFPVITVSVQNAVDQMHLGVATGLLTFLRSLGAALGVALLGAVALAYDLPLMGEGTSIGTALSSAAPFAMIFLACAAMLAASLVALGLMPEKPLRGSGHAEAPVLVE